jgi:predicted amidohydrolase YtcJ
VPGFNDVHTHILSGGLEIDNINLQGVQTLAAVQDRIRAFAAAHPDRSWVRGRGWGYGPLADFEDVLGDLFLSAINGSLKRSATL